MPESVSTSEFSLNQALSQRRTCREFSDQPVPYDAVKRMLWAAQGKTDDSGNRTVPSAHALHPLRLLITVGNVETLASGIYTVNSDVDNLFAVVHRDARAALQAAAVDEQPWIAQAAGIITICADMVTPTQDFADQLPLGMRGARYVYLEAGAAAQNVQLQATVDGLGCVLVAGFKDEATAGVLKLAGVSHE